MNILESSQQLRDLARAHANYKISSEDYRSQRKVLLDRLDKSLNGVLPEANSIAVEPMQSVTDNDKTQPYLVGKLEQCLSFLKKNNDN